MTGYACMMADSQKIDIHDVPENLTGGSGDPRNSYPMVSMQESGRLHAQRVLLLTGGDKTETARVLNVSRATLHGLLSGAAAG